MLLVCLTLLYMTPINDLSSFHSFYKIALDEYNSLWESKYLSEEGINILGNKESNFKSYTYLSADASELFEKYTFNLNETVQGILFNNTDVLNNNTEGIGIE